MTVAQRHLGPLEGRGKPGTGWRSASASQGPKSGGSASLRLHLREDFLEPLILSEAQFKPREEEKKKKKD